MKMLVAFVAISLSLGWLSPASAVDETPINIEVTRAFPNLRIRRPVVITHAGDGSNRLFIVTQQGVVHVMPNRDDVQESDMKVFLDIEDKVVYDDRKNEEGLLGLAFHPKYKENGQFYLYYTTRDAPQTSVVTRFTVSKDDPNKADPDSEFELMRIAQPFWNHNGGTVIFGPDGYLYVALGDGGAGNDPTMNGQNVQTLLGSILRIDVDTTTAKPQRNYGIPADNPFANDQLARPEIYAYGLRNPWRMAFDEDGTFWAADVGQNLWEEINIIQNGGNYGWNLREGFHKFGPAGAEARADLIEPIWEYDHETGKSITGGQVYRGKKVPSLDGYYLYADYVSSRFWALKYNAKTEKVEENRPIHNEGPKPIMTFGSDEAGEVYCSDSFGMIYRFQAK